jgi:hypothetical protein
MLPHNRASVVVAANAGWYLMPEWRSDRTQGRYPFSLVSSRAGEAELRSALTRRVVVMLGEADTDPADPELSKSDGAMRQGTNRFERGKGFFAAANAAARDLGVKFTWELVGVPGVAHEGDKMGRAAARYLYGGQHKPGSE